MLSLLATSVRRAALPAALLLPSACSCPPLVESYASPEETLLAWQAHLCRDDAQGEYACLSAGFQRAMGGFPTYHAARAALLEREPATAWLFARADLLEHLTASERDDERGDALLVLSSGEERVEVAFERETWLIITWDDGRREPVNQGQPLSRLLGARDGQQWLTILKPALDPARLGQVRGLAVESRWKIAALAGLAPSAAGATGEPAP